MPAATSRRLSSIERQALLSGALVLLSVLALLLIAFLGFDTLSSARAYVGGEGLWSKAQKDAVYHLTRYATGRDPADFEAFRQSLTVPLGDRLARVELQRRDPEWDSVRAGFLRGRNNSEDIPGMGRFFRRFHSVDFVAEAVSDWTRGDSLIERLAEVAEQLHREIQGPAPDPAHIRENLAEIHVLGQALTRFEDHFSAAIGAGARWASRVLAVLVAVTAALILVIAGMTLRQTTRRFTVAEAARKASDEELRELVRHARIGISRTSLDGRFLAANPALVRMLGYDTEAELLTLDPDRDLYDQPAERRAGIDRLLADGALTAEVRLRHRSGSLLQVRSHNRLIRGPDGAPAMIEGFLEDVTQQRRLEAQLRQGQKLEAVGQVTGGIAHEFNNLLTVILSTAKLLEEHLPAGDHPARVDLADLTAAARRGADMIRQLLALSRDRQLQFQPEDLGRLVEAGAAVLRRLLEPGIEVQVEVHSGAPLVQTDPFSIEQILLTLATNARDALPRGGVLRIITGPAPPDPATGGARALLEVSDNGLGMDAATRERLFEPFFTTKPAGQGTGLGLAMVQGLVKQHGGTVEVHSAPGRGTLVRMYFPASDAPATEARPAPSAAPPRDRRGTILLVEDEDALRRATERLLRRHGYEVVSARDGADALEICKRGEQAIHLILSDVVMPNVGGAALHAELLRRGIRIPMVFTSGYTARDRGGPIDLPDGAPFLPKPWEIRELLLTLEAMMEGPPPGGGAG